MFAYHEAVALGRRGLQILSALPDTDQRAEKELALLLTLGAPVIQVSGYGSTDVKDAYDRARSLCERLGRTEQLFEVLIGFDTVDLREAKALLDELAGNLLIAETPNNRIRGVRGPIR